MKTAIFRTELSSKALALVKSIIKTEDLDLNISIAENALGDTVIKVKGSTAEVATLRAIYGMVG